MTIDSSSKLVDVRCSLNDEAKEDSAEKLRTWWRNEEEEDFAVVVEPDPLFWFLNDESRLKIISPFAWANEVASGKLARRFDGLKIGDEEESLETSSCSVKLFLLLLLLLLLFAIPETFVTVTDETRQPELHSTLIIFLMQKNREKIKKNTWLFVSSKGKKMIQINFFRQKHQNKREKNWKTHKREKKNNKFFWGWVFLVVCFFQNQRNKRKKFWKAKEPRKNRKFQRREEKTRKKGGKKKGRKKKNNETKVRIDLVLFWFLILICFWLKKKNYFFSTKIHDFEKKNNVRTHKKKIFFFFPFYSSEEDDELDDDEYWRFWRNWLYCGDLRGMWTPPCRPAYQTLKILGTPGFGSPKNVCGPPR